MSSPGIVESIDIKRIHTSTYNPRADFGRLEELMASIEDTGLLQPIVVRPVEDGFEVVAGNRRLEACRRLRWRKILANVVELEDMEAFEASLIENIQRRTLHPIEEARAFRRYVSEYGWGGVSELARRIGKSQEYVSRRIHLLDLPEEVQDELASYRLSPSLAVELLSLRDPEQQSELGHIAASNRLTKRDVRSIVRLAESEEIASMNFTRLDRDRKVADRALRRAIAVFRTALLRIDDVIEDVEGQWVLRELLMGYRLFLHDRISSLIKERKRLDSILGQEVLEAPKATLKVSRGL